ncbi:MAG TPA: 2-oxoacid:ferredoxin oxidoreductase subunit beta [Gemmatimonadales bacterium]|nr:2-oxoacid:ferredoxin oxidoreductase subunit beta [Gemmatimonadales bacterium]
MPNTGQDLRKYLRVEMMPNVWCPGCGHGNISRAVATAMESMALDPDQVVLVGGIGCAGRTPFYMNTHAMHTTHGRALAYATGIKLAKPSLTVIAVLGDGDALAIGGNHFLHACRRNIDITAVIYNNGIYGMTGGQAAPTTPEGFRSATTSLGNIEPPFDIVSLALAAGATYVARTTTFDAREMPALIEAAIRHRGLSVVEILTQCPTFYGRMNRLGDASQMLDYERDITMPLVELTRDEVARGLPIGVFRDEVKPEYVERYQALVQRAVRGDDA